MIKTKGKENRGEEGKGNRKEERHGFKVRGRER